MKKIFPALLFIFFPLLAHAQSFHPLSLVRKDGSDVMERVETPYKFVRVKAAEGSFAQFLRGYPLEEPGSPVLLYNGNKKNNQESHAAVFALPVGGLQDSSGSVIMLYAMYMRSIDSMERICFHFENGEECRWAEWEKKYEVRRNERTALAGSLKKWTKYENPPERGEAFEKYLMTVLRNSSLLSVFTYESEKIGFGDVEAGDFLWDFGKGERMCLVVDVCMNPETGEKAFLLAQGGEPAQSFHLLNNPRRVNDPWYYQSEISRSVVTPEHVFPAGSWRRPKYLEWQK